MIRTWTPESETPTPPGGTDYRTVKAWFQQCRTLAAAVEARHQKIRRLRDVAEKTTPSLSGMPGGGGAGDKVGSAVERLDTEERELRQMTDRLCSLRTEATRRLAKCIHGQKDGQRQADCLYLYYVCCQKQRDICARLDLPEENQVSTYIRRGCTYLAQSWQAGDNS